MSGVVDPRAGLPELPGLELTWVRLDASDTAMERRLRPDLDLSATLAEAARYRALPVPAQPTDGLSAAEVASRITWSAPDSEPPGEVEPARTSPGRIVWLTGPTAVGKSTVGFQMFLRAAAKGSAAYLDAGQLAFTGPSRPSPDIHAGMLAACQRTFGADTTIISGTPVVPLPGPATVTCYRLQAGPAELARRRRSWAAGGSWHEPGRPDKVIEVDTGDRTGVPVGTDGLTAGEIADLLG